METLELIHIDNSDYRAIVNLIDRMTEGEEEEFDICYTKGYVEILIKGIAYREFDTVTGTSFGSHEETWQECTRLDVDIKDVSVYDDGEPLECDFDVEKLKGYLN